MGRAGGCINHWRLPNPLGQCHRGQPSLPIAVDSHIDDVGDSPNDGITSRRSESGIRFVFQLMTWSKRHMVRSRMQEPQRVSGEKATVGRLFLLDLSDDCVVSLNPDGADRKVVVTEGRYPDGIAVDVAAGHIYWTNMGNPAADDGSIERADFDGRNRRTIIPEGGTFTPKQLQLEKQSGELYWCDREGMRVMRANLDGSDIETLVDTGQGDPRPGPDPAKWCVGVAIDVDGDRVYWTQKGPDNAGKGRLFRAGIDIPTGQTASDRADIELLYDGLPEPIDLELAPNNRVVYWTDRGDPPRGNTGNPAPLDR